MFAETDKEVLLEYNIDTVYNTLYSIFPLEQYKLSYYNHLTYNFTVIDSFNSSFTMDITLTEDNNNNTLVFFRANYPQALMDLTGGGQQAINTVLDELLGELDKQSLQSNLNSKEVLNSEDAAKYHKDKSHTITIITGYALSVVCFILFLTSWGTYGPTDSDMMILFLIGVLCLTMQIILSVILQYYTDSQSVLHGKVQTCISGALLVMLGFMIHPSLIIAGLLIPILALNYFRKRTEYIKQTNRDKK